MRRLQRQDFVRGAKRSVSIHNRCSQSAFRDRTPISWLQLSDFMKPFVTVFLMKTLKTPPASDVFIRHSSGEQCITLWNDNLNMTTVGKRSRDQVQGHGVLRGLVGLSHVYSITIEAVLAVDRQDRGRRPPGTAESGSLPP